MGEEAIEAQLQHAVWIGLAATFVMTVVLHVLPAFGFPRTDVAYILGSLIRAPRHRAVQYGFAMHFGMGVVFAFLYGFAFLILDIEPSWWVGLIAGMVHWVVIMLAMNPFGEVHHEIQEGRMRAPGLFMSNLGTAYGAASLVRHLSFGVMVGWLYRVVA